MYILEDKTKNSKYFQTSEKFMKDTAFESKSKQEISTEEIKDHLKEWIGEKLHNLSIKEKDLDTTSGITDDAYTIQSDLSCNLSDISSTTTATENNKEEICVLSENGLDVDDIKLVEGLLEIERLDQQLAMKQAEEQKLKEKRLNFKKLFESELEQLNLLKRKESQEERENTLKYIAWESERPENTREREYDNKQAVCIRPIFQTQLPEDESDHHHTVHSVCKEEGKKLTIEGVKLQKNNEQHLETNFIKKNVELVMDACGIFSLTMQEKQRLDQLLQDLSTEDLEGYNESEDMLQLSMALGKGFVPTQEEQNTLESIENKLKFLLQNDYHKTEEKFNNAQDRLQEQDLHHRMNNINIELEKLNSTSKEKLCNSELQDLVMKCSQELENLSIKPQLSYAEITELINAVK
ncbi:fibrous sheath-interacting protein 1-like [Limulus polyphemus]|uniref:Fibrous sheath-interacting protein 1 n=1 Tax=Limulus polyphemus TaxID=6850 RepID=A0ABM1BA39_LIMPO|nr:fibrous sheath-interacting protein 1-like [Limulus polyphemus]